MILAIYYPKLERMNREVKIQNIGLADSWVSNHTTIIKIIITLLKKCFLNLRNKHIIFCGMVKFLTIAQ